MKDKIKEDLQSILNTAHYHEKKRDIKETKNSYQFSCPVCGDSVKDVSKKRAHILFDKATPYFYCHHECGGMTMQRFYGHFNMKWVEPTDEFDFFQSPIKSKPTYKYDPKEMALSEVSKLAIPIGTIMETFGATRIDENTPGWDYLVQRNLTQYKDYFLYWPEKHRLIILNTLHEPETVRRWNQSGYYFQSECDVIGFQARALGNHSVKYITYTLEKIRGEAGLDYRPAPGTEDYVKLLSQVFYSTHVDWTKEVLITEGPIDALFLENSIALTGVGKTNRKIDENYLCQYIFDNDKTGKEKQWDKKKNFSNKSMFDWFNLCKQIGTDDVKDINDVVNYCHNTGIEIPKFKDYLI